MSLSKTMIITGRHRTPSDYVILTSDCDALVSHIKINNQNTIIVNSYSLINCDPMNFQDLMERVIRRFELDAHRTEAVGECVGSLNSAPIGGLRRKERT